ncbi:hypothetical protein MIT9_P1458 [Methylomarinovum caldicuralii]|uniref:Ancillary SecYEG translocon subunit n=1 Tax=Methylomarinovum caldicuralii TaxID=438856 RepID=A0AAU9C8S1_9GAMM|nr:tetratricopeptide repeat protein [Methylomarinovum caldicuralii]BCX81876.1 hypothetical protein MIT9_P1458 [Methylomarinovum caldicuralii]
MAAHLEEEAQVEQLKRWWKENGASIIAGVILGLVAIFGWNAWQKHQRTQAEQASNLYQQMLDAVAKGQDDLAFGLAQRLTGELAGTAYADFARLLEARAAVDKGELPRAQAALEALLRETGDDNFRHIARLRLARVHLGAGKPEAALDVLTVAGIGDPGRFAGQYEELRGDAFAALGKPEDAALAYRKALALGRDYEYLKMKLNDLGVAASKP